MAQKERRLAILGAGNIGVAIARGLIRAGTRSAGTITLTRRKAAELEPLAMDGFRTTTDNAAAVADADDVLVAVAPAQVQDVLGDISDGLDPARHVLMSVVSGVGAATLRGQIPPGVPVVRVMPNTAVAIGESMTCLSAAGTEPGALERAQALFDTVGRTLVIDEERMSSATALGACGVAFFLRAIRAASQGGIEVGFHAPEAITIAAQTARGAASLLLQGATHPEGAIDMVTTPQGCTISGLNEMEHRGFSSAMIKGIVVSAEKASRLYVADGDR